MSAPDRGFWPPAETGAPPQRRAGGVDPAVGRNRDAAAPLAAGTIELDARIVAEGLGIAPEEVEPARLAGFITTLCERGTGEDAGLMRATFYLGKRRLRLLLDRHGRVLQRQPAADQPDR